MPEFVPRLRIFVSSPGDVAEERRNAREVIERLPREPLLEGKLAVDAVMWDAPSAPVPLEANETPQATVNRYKGLASDCDLVVVILWKRIGTPLGGDFRKSDGSAYRSGTEFEFLDAVAHRRPLWIYHRAEPFEPPNDGERRQKEGVKQFLDDIRRLPGEPTLGGINEYALARDFGPLFKLHLEAFVRRWLDGDSLGGSAGGEGSPHWLLRSLISVSTSGADSQITIHRPAGPLVVAREHWPEFNDVQRTYRWFVGRVEVLGRAAAFLDHHSCGYFRIVGGAGLGKTALAVEIARRYRAPAYFASAPAGRTVPDYVLGALCAQVIVRYELAHRQLPPHAGETADALVSLLEEAATKCKDPVVIVIDALDEIDATPPGHNWLHLPKALPENVYVVLLHRPGEFPVVVDPSVAVEATNIEDEPDAQRRDVEAYLRHEVSRADVAAALKRAVPPIPPETLVTRLSEASEGNFMYLSYVLGDIASAPDGPRFGELPSGLEGYYLSVWTQLSESRKSDRAAWRTVQRPVLALLAAAREPVTAEWLAKHSGADPDDVRELALLPWSRFLARAVRAPKWRVLHRSFSDFLAARSEIDLSGTHARIAEYYLKDLSKAEADDGYAYGQLSAHLVEAGRLDDLGALIEREDWCRSQRRRDPSGRRYSVDVSRAVALARARGAPEVGAAVAWSMLYGTVATMASEVPEDALAALVVLGNEELALANAALVTDAEKRLSAHVRIASTLLELEKREAAASVATLAAAILPEIWPGNRPDWKSPIVDLLSKAGRTDLAHGLASEKNNDDDDATDHAAGPEDQAVDETQASYLALNDFVRRLASAGERINRGEAATEALDDAFNGVTRLCDDLRRRALTAITYIVNQLRTANDERGLARLEELILGHGGGPASASFLGLLAAARASMGDMDHARTLLSEAEKRFGSSDADRWVKDTITGELAARRVEVEGHAALAGALARIERIGSYHYGVTLAGITKILQDNGDKEGLRDVFACAEAVAEEDRAELLGCLAEAFLGAKMEGEADDVRKSAEAIVTREPRLAAVSAVSISYARAGRRDAALRMIDEVIAGAQTIPYSSSEVSALCGVATGLEMSGAREAALGALTLAERASDPQRPYGRKTLAIAVGQLRNKADGCAMLDAMVSTNSPASEGEEENVTFSGEALARIAPAMAKLGHVDGLSHLRAVALDRLSYAVGKARVLIGIGAAQSELGRLDDAAAAFDESLGHLLGAVERGQDGSVPASDLFKWFEELVSALRTKPELVAKLQACNALDRAISMAKGAKDEEWGDTVRSGAARLLAHMRDSLAVEELRAEVAVHEPGRSAQIRAEQAILAAADGDGDGASRLLRAGRDDAEHALLDSPHLPEWLIALAEACGAVRSKNELDELVLVGERLQPEARAMFLFAAAEARIRFGDVELARPVVERSISLGLTAPARLTLSEPEHIAWRLSGPLTSLAGQSDGAVERWVADLLSAASRSGRESVLGLIEPLVPVLQRLGALSLLWRHWQRIDTLFIRSPAS